MVSMNLAKASPVTDLAAAPIMVNLGNVKNSPNSVFLNRAKQGAGWLTPSGTAWPTVNLTSSGEIASLPSGITEAWRYLMLLPTTTTADITSINAIEAGQFRLTWTGGPTTCTISGVTVNSTGTRSVTFTTTGVNNFLATFSSLDTLGFPSDLVMVRTADLALYDAGEIFDPDFLAPLTSEKFEAFRFMEWAGLNETTAIMGAAEVDWADRSTTSSVSWWICPVEIMVALCNKVMVSPWFCMPHQSTTDYWTQHATYVRDNLHPDLVARYELSNEGWNSIYPQYAYFLSQGQALFGTSVGDEHVHYYGYKMAQLASTLDTVYGSNRRHLMVGAWSVFHAEGATMLTATRWQTLDPTNYIAPHSVIDEMAIAPYYGGTVAGNATIWTTFAASGEAAAAAHINSFIPAALATSKGYVTSWKTVADSYSLPLISYENGLHVELNYSSNVNLRMSEFTVPNGNAYTVGERVNQTGTSATALVLSKSATGLVLDTEATPAFNATGVLTGVSSGAAQTPTALAQYNPKSGVVELFEVASYNADSAAYFTDHMTNCREAGMRYFALFNHMTVFSKYGAFGLQRWNGDENLRKVAVDDWITANPRSWPQINKRRVVTWP